MVASVQNRSMPKYYENICDDHHSSNFKYQSRDLSGCQNLGFNCLNGASSKRAEFHEVQIRRPRLGKNIPTKANE